MIPSHLDFRRLKHAVTIEQVLADKGLLRRLHRRGSRLVGPCPIHGGDNVTAFVVDVDRNIWRCFTGCNGGDVVEMARLLSDGSFHAAAHYLAQLADSAPVPRFVRRNPRFRPFTRRLPLDPSHALLARKGITEQTARLFEVGAYHGNGMLSGCVGFRLLDLHGRPLGYAGRRLEPDQAQKLGKWVFPPRLPKASLLYGYHQARHQLHRGVNVVEGAWAVLRLFQLGIPAVAILGSALSPQQRDILLRLPKITLLLDGDQPGRRATESILSQLSHATPVNLQDGTDPDDLSDDDLFCILTQTRRLPF